MPSLRIPTDLNTVKNSTLSCSSMSIAFYDAQGAEDNEYFDRSFVAHGDTASTESLSQKNSITGGMTKVSAGKALHVDRQVEEFFMHRFSSSQTYLFI